MRPSAALPPPSRNRSKQNARSSEEACRSWQLRIEAAPGAIDHASRPRPDSVSAVLLSGPASVHNSASGIDVTIRSCRSNEFTPPALREWHHHPCPFSRNLLHDALSHLEDTAARRQGNAPHPVRSSSHAASLSKSTQWKPTLFSSRRSGLVDVEQVFKAFLKRRCRASWAGRKVTRWRGRMLFSYIKFCDSRRVSITPVGNRCSVAFLIVRNATEGVPYSTLLGITKFHCESNRLWHGVRRNYNGREANQRDTESRTFAHRRSNENPLMSRTTRLIVAGWTFHRRQARIRSGKAGIPWHASASHDTQSSLYFWRPCSCDCPGPRASRSRLP